MLSILTIGALNVFLLQDVEEFSRYPRRVVISGLRELYNYVIKKIFLRDSNLDLCDLWTEDISYTKAQGQRYVKS